MEDFTVLIGVLSSASIAVNIYIIKSIADLCTRLSRLEGKLSKN
tara:strand:+ start:461 stop:592 length:132 start_codon:yes stop_codon:yes gene_type:complete